MWSCKTIDTTQHHAGQHYATLHRLDTIALRDSIAIRDSTFTSERQRGDTIYRDRIHYRDRIEYRDRWHERLVHDTVVQTDSIVRVIEHPPRKYVPKFHKWCTGLFWVIVLLALVWIVLRLWLKR